MRRIDGNNEPDQSRRDFIRNSTKAALISTVAASMATIPGAYAAGSDLIKVGLVGCGGRGIGAVNEVLQAAPGVKIVAIGDLFKEAVEAGFTKINNYVNDSTIGPEIKRLGNVIDIKRENCFYGFDAFEKVIASDVNYIILATPPAFRSQHLKAAVAAGKHIFTEKPVAVDSTGIRTVLAVYEEAVKKGLGIAAGTQRRHDAGYRELMKRVQDGAIGEIITARAYWNQGGLWKRDRKPEWTDLEWQIHNWIYFTWLSGDHIVEQHIHNVDVINWALGTHPIKATGMGGRQSRTGPEYGHVFDHFTVDFEYENGMHLLSMCRQIEGTDKNVSESLVGTKGTTITQPTRQVITGQNRWAFNEKSKSAYILEHADLIESIRAGKPINELKTIAESNLTMIMGRMSAYTGKEVTWQQAMDSKEDLIPSKLVWGPMPVPPVPIPGLTELI
jgi:myo-inositol 2-dehydrogenase / D-chiro-inositol 1-dehydrogenase